MSTLQTCLPHLSDVAILPREIQKVIFQHYCAYTSDYMSGGVNLKPYNLQQVHRALNTNAEHTLAS